MIRLQVEDYCQECINFIPDLNTSTLYSDNEPYSVCHTVTCLYSVQCRRAAEETRKKILSEMTSDCPGGVHE